MPVHRPEHKRPGVAFGPAQLKAASAGRRPPRKAAMAPPKPVRRVRRAVAPSGPVRGVRGAVKGAVKAVAARAAAGPLLTKEIAAIREVIHGKEIGKFIDALQKARSGPTALPLMEKKRLHRQTPTLRSGPTFEMPEGLPSKRPLPARPPPARPALRRTAPPRLRRGQR